MQVGKHLDMLHEISQKCDMYGFLDPGATHASMHIKHFRKRHLPLPLNKLTSYSDDDC